MHSGTGEESNDDCVHDKIHAFLKSSNQSALVVWVCFQVSNIVFVMTTTAAQDNTDMDSLLENADVNDAGIDDDTVGTQQVSS
jgi:hypothetical protein